MSDKKHQIYVEPIDIKYEKLYDWLISRNIISPKRSNEMQQIIKLSRELSLKLPDHLKYLLPKNEELFSYIHCKTIFDVLLDEKKSNGQDTVDLFGRYKDQELKSWYDLKRKYEYKDLFLFDSSRIFSKIINFIIPSYKKLSKENDREINTLLSQKKELFKSIQSVKTQLMKMYNQWNIPDNDYTVTTLKQELYKNSPKLIEFLKEIAELLHGDTIVRARKYYEEFMQYTKNKPSSFETLDHFLSLPVEFPDFSNSLSFAKNDSIIDLRKSDKIDILNTNEINWDTNINNDSNSEINWDISGPNNNQILDNTNQNTINWDIDIIDSGNVDNLDIHGIEIEESGKQTDRETCGSKLLDIKYRTELIINLNELSSFFHYRIYEMNSNNTNTYYNLVGANDYLMSVNSKDLSSYMDYINNINKKLADKSFIDLIQLITDEEYIENMCLNITNKFQKIDAIKQNLNLIDSSIKDYQEKNNATSSDIDECIKSIESYKPLVESKISLLFQNTPIHLYGNLK